MRPQLRWARVAVVLPIVAGLGQAQEKQAETALRALAAKVERFGVIELPATGSVELSPDQSLTVDDLRGVALDDDPPVLGAPTPEYPPKMTDDCPAAQEPYVARGIEPFRFRYFNNEFSYGGWHTWKMTDYASTHGFSILSSYNHDPADWTHVPEGTRWLRWGGFVHWEKWLEDHEIPPLRYDMLADMDVEQMLVDAGTFEQKSGFDSLMIDMEHARLSPEKLREQEWYPKDAAEAERAAFEAKYYEGYAKTYVAPVQAARRAGWEDISVYGWQPFARAWFGLDKVELDPATDWAWNAFGKAIHEAVDILNPSVYCFYWSPQNVAYTLANIDLNMKLIETMPEQKPVRPYYWTLLHGGGGGWRWWKGQPQRDEDVRAMIAFCFFSGCDGFVCWNWSGTGSHQVPPPLEEGADVMVGVPFECPAEGDAEPTRFERHDVLHVLSAAEDGQVRFQRIEKGNHQGNYGVSEDRPVYAMAEAALVPRLRAQAEPVAATIEGMALAKPFEYLLRHGEVKIDVPAQQQFAETLPIVRRVRLGKYSVIATYDPGWAEAEEPRQIVLDDFDGHAGLTLVLPADAAMRVFVPCRQ